MAVMSTSPHIMVELMDGVCEGNVSRILSGRNRPEDAVHPEDVNLLQLNLGSFLIKIGEVDIEPPLRALCAPSLPSEEARSMAPCRIVKQ